MSGGGAGATEEGFDTMAIPWTCLFQGDGVAIHGVFWHNDFGTPKSHGCVNTLPEDAKWIFRWTTPNAPYYKGDISDPVNYSGTPSKWSRDCIDFPDFVMAGPAVSKSTYNIMLWLSRHYMDLINAC
jgi:hypothetical protein